MICTDLDPVVQVQRTSRKLRLRLWMESSVFASPQPENQCCATGGGASFSSAPKSGDASGWFTPAWQARKSIHGERPHVRCRRARTLRPGSGAVPGRTPSGWANQPQTGRSALHLRSAICEHAAQSVAVGSVFHPHSWKIAGAKDRLIVAVMLELQPVCRKGRSRKSCEFQG